jgi:beta-phosphoglucomutase-like phosphatase (HAD superfamily)
MIKAVIFDVDGVLIDSYEANFQFYRRLFNLAGYKPPTREKFSSLFPLTMEKVIKMVTNSSSDEEIKRIWLMGKNRVVPYPYELIKLPDNLDIVINKLKEKYLLSIVTSRIRGGIFKIPQMAKYEKDFKVVIYFEDTLKHKPDPEPLLLAVNKLHIKSEEAIYIGDTKVDIQASRSAGMKIILYSKTQIKGVDAFTSEFSQIPALIESLNTRQS